MKTKYRFIPFLLLLLLGLTLNKAHAQDTESKEDPTYIIVYIRLQVEASPCGTCYDSLSTKIKRIPGVRAVAMDVPKSFVQFQMHSSQLVNEQVLRILAQESDLVPVEVLYEKEAPDKEDDEISF